MLDILKNEFSDFIPYINGWEQMKRASVIIPIVKKDREYYVLFQLRAKHMKAQPGEISFPGGKIERNETPAFAASRELCEELGIQEEDFEIITPLDLLITHYGLLIHPYLGYIKKPENIKINKDEVDHVFLVPLNFLLTIKPLQVNNEVIVNRNDKFPFQLIPQGENYNFKNGVYHSLFYIYNDYVIWGLTGKILENFIKIFKDKNIIKL